MMKPTVWLKSSLKSTRVRKRQKLLHGRNR
jgi:hypothetical protein